MCIFQWDELKYKQTNKWMNKFYLTTQQKKHFDSFNVLIKLEFLTNVVDKSNKTQSNALSLFNCSVNAHTCITMQIQ